MDVYVHIMVSAITVSPLPSNQISPEMLAAFSTDCLCDCDVLSVGYSQTFVLLSIYIMTYHSLIDAMLLSWVIEVCPWYNECQTFSFSYALIQSRVILHSHHCFAA